MPAVQQNQTEWTISDQAILNGSEVFVTLHEWTLYVGLGADAIKPKQTLQDTVDCRCIPSSDLRLGEECAI